MARQIYHPWNKGKLVGQKLPLKQREIWSIRVRLQLADRRLDLALFNLAIDSKLRACDPVGLRLRMWATPGASWLEPPSGSRRQSGQSSLR